MNKQLGIKLGLKLVLGITGGVAAYKSAELMRLLVKAGIDVQVVMTESACQFITPLTMQALSGKPVFTNMWDASIDNGMPHIELSRLADAILIAPASANFIAKLAHGFADDLLSTLCLARDCALLVAPAMNKQMWENPATQRNILQLTADGIHVFGPDSGEQACGEVGLGRMLEAADLFSLVNTHFTPKLLAGKHVLITAGATLEMIDPVRAITNLSSGKMGFSLAEAARDMGATVTLIRGASVLPNPSGINVIEALSANAMYQSVMQNIAPRHSAPQDIFICVAAVADYSPKQKYDQKIKKNAQTLSLELEQNKDILAEVASLPNAPFCVGFAAESENLIEHAEQKRLHKKLPLIVANLVADGMGGDENLVTLIDDLGSHPLPKADKKIIAHEILHHAYRLISR